MITQISPQYTLSRTWVDHRGGLDVLEKKKILAAVGEFIPSLFVSVRSPYVFVLSSLPWLFAFCPCFTTHTHTHIYVLTGIFCFLLYCVCISSVLVFFFHLDCPAFSLYNTQHRHSCFQRDSIPQSQQVNCRSPSPKTAWPLGSAHKHPCPRRNSNPQPQQAISADLRVRPLGH